MICDGALARRRYAVAICGSARWRWRTRGPALRSFRPFWPSCDLPCGCQALCLVSEHPWRHPGGLVAPLVAPPVVRWPSGWPAAPGSCRGLVCRGPGHPRLTVLRRVPRAAVVQLPHHLLSAVTPSALGCCRGCVDVVLMCCFLPRREKKNTFDGSKKRAAQPESNRRSLASRAYALVPAPSWPASGSTGEQ